MSRHTTTGKIGEAVVVVTAGWDRPLQYFFLDVDRFDREEDDDAVYASMYDSRLFGAGRGGPERPVGGLGWEEFLERLAELCLELPAGMLEALQQDQRLNTGNRTAMW